MCGITGIFNVNGAPVSVSVLKRMTDAVQHRGPDGEGVWTSSFVGFGHRRLAIIDLSPLNHQPMQSSDGSVMLVYNGEIYNFQNLRVELEAKGYQFRSTGDTEVLLNAYHAWRRVCQAAQRDVRVRDLGSPSASSVHRSRSVRRQTAVLPLLQRDIPLWIGGEVSP